MKIRGIEDINRMMSVLGLTPHSVNSALEQYAVKSEEALASVWVQLVKDARKKMLRECHPDVCGEKSTEKAQLVNAAADALLTVRPRPKRLRYPFPGPPPIYSPFSTSSTSTSTTYNGYTININGTSTVIFMK